MSAYPESPDNPQRGFDVGVGRRLRRRREQVGMSQQQLADGLRDYLFTWHQTTVGKVESGERPLRLSEALAIAKVLGLGFSLDDLIRDQTGSRLRMAELEAAQRELERIDRWVNERRDQLAGEWLQVRTEAERGDGDGEHQQEA